MFREKKPFYKRPAILGVLLGAVAALVILVTAAVGQVRTDVAAQSVASVRQAVLRSAVQCYCVEGVYPQSVSYLEEHYGLLLDHTKYIVSYDAFSSNLLPQVTVLTRGAS